jgi:hypothetical protein
MELDRYTEFSGSKVMRKSAEIKRPDRFTTCQVFSGLTGPIIRLL